MNHVTPVEIYCCAYGHLVLIFVFPPAGNILKDRCIQLVTYKITTVILIFIDVVTTLERKFLIGYYTILIMMVDFIWEPQTNGVS